MKTRTTVEIMPETRNLQFGYWDMEAKRFVDIGNMDDEERQQTAELLDCSPILLDALVMFAETIVDVVGRDLCDIWKRLDAADIK